MVEEQKATASNIPAKQAVYTDEQAAFSPAYESGEEYGGQGTGEDADYEDGNINNLLVASGAA